MLRSSRVSRTEVATEPVSVAELRTHLRIDTKEHDEELRSLITAARQTIEEVYLWKLLIDQTCIEYYDFFSDGMELRWLPVDSITSITYLDADAASQTLAATVYELTHINGQGVVRLKYGQSFPTTLAHPDSVYITYVAGYGAAADVPQAIRRALLLYAGGLFDGDPPLDAMNSLLAPYVTQRVLGW